jgi:hypothetical protein
MILLSFPKYCRMYQWNSRLQEVERRISLPWEYCWRQCQAALCINLNANGLSKLPNLRVGGCMSSYWV